MEDKILEELREIKGLSLLAAKNVLTIEEVAKLTDLSVSCLYKKTCAKEIPYYKKDKRIYFKRQEIEEWMLQNRISTNAELEQSAINYTVTGRLTKKG